jgi:hypothetical protein
MTQKQIRREKLAKHSKPINFTCGICLQVVPNNPKKHLVCCRCFPEEKEEEN